jgi:NAD(P)H-quinone oxidoreductase subunit 5
LELSPVLRGVVIALGLVTAAFAALSGRVQTDVKSALSYACLTQIGVIVIEIGLGFYYLALVHIIGHACLRTLQFLRAPTLLRDYSTLENAIGNRLPHTQGSWEDRLSPKWQARLYRFGMERAYLDTLLSDYVVSPFLRIFKKCDGWERRWTDWLSGGQSRESDRVRPQLGSLEEFT